MRGATSRVRQLLEKFKESNTIPHAATKGALREAYLRQFLAEFIPVPFEIKSGFVTDCRGAEVSPQIDLLVFDRTSIPAFALTDFVTIVPLEAARLAIEVKSTLRIRDLSQIKSQQESIRQMRFAWTTPRHEYLQTVDSLGITQHIVAFDTDCAEDTLKTWFHEEPALNVICIIGKYVLLRHPNTGEIESIPADATHSEVMQAVSSLFATVLDAQRELRMREVDTPTGTAQFEPNLGAYLAFDVPFPTPQ